MMTIRALRACAVVFCVAVPASAMAVELTDMQLDAVTAAASTAAGFDLALSGGGLSSLESVVYDSDGIPSLGTLGVSGSSGSAAVDAFSGGRTTETTPTSSFTFATFQATITTQGDGQASLTPTTTADGDYTRTFGISRAIGLGGGTALYAGYAVAVAFDRPGLVSAP
jgi:hypothetical protein